MEEMLEIFNEYHLNKYITTPCVRLVDPLHPTLDESIDMIRNLRTVNLITRGLPRNWITLVPSYQTYGKVYIRSGTQHGIHNRPYGYG